MITGAPDRSNPQNSALLDLPLFRQPALARTLEPSLKKLLSILGDRRWHTAKELKVHGFGDRELRDLVENADGRVLSYPGSPGYKLFEAATLEEFRAADALRNQGRAMWRRWIRYQNRYHRGK